MKRKIISCILIIFFIAAVTYVLISKRGVDDTDVLIQSSQNDSNKYTATVIDLFDTKTDIIGYTDGEEQFNKDANQVVSDLQYYNRIYDIYNDYDGINNVKTINDNAGDKPVTVDKELIDMIKFGKEMYYETDGRINIAMGAVLSIWHEYREAGLDNPAKAKLPTKEELQEANQHTNIEDIIIDEENCTVFLKDSKMSLDVGGIAKGYAVQKAVDKAKKHGISNILLNVGGNISCIGARADGTNFMVAIQNPDLESDELYADSFGIEDGTCVVSSGDYQRFYEVDGKRYCHIINPDTLFPSEEFAQISIVTKDSASADAYSTALFNMTLEEGKEFISNHDGVEAMWVKPDGTKVYSDGFDNLVDTDN
ncbi:MAG: FAD:protein FMN transferase [Pseudobutyrivibrio sp.]|nr:FAD:protein FMN transferase [Pseudobutyrivibrio sp.]